MKFINGLHFNNIRGDIYGGLTAAVVALPLALAMGVTSGAGPVAGIYGAIFVGLFASLFGGTPAQVSGPTGPMTVVMAAVLTQYTTMFPDNPEHGAALAFTVVIMGGVLQAMLGLMKLGRFINLIPHPVVSGFMSGIGVIIILLEIPPLFGYALVSSPKEAIDVLPKIASNPVILDPLLIGCLAMAIVYFLPKRINQFLPSPLFALIIGTLVLYLWQGGDITTAVESSKEIYRIGEVPVLGNIPTAIPMPMLPVFESDLLIQMVKSALTLAALGSIDSLLTSLVADNITRTHHNSDRELVGQGIGNTIAGIFGGLPGAGATMRTVVNVRAGGLTPISGALHAIVLLTMVLGAGSIARYIPHALLAGILIKVGTDIIDWDYLKRLRHMPVTGIVVMITVFLITVFVDLITAVAIGMIMASFIFMQRMADLQVESVTAITDPHDESPLSSEESELLAAAKGHILLYHISGPMSFGAAKDMVRILANFEAYDVLILDLSDVPQVDFTSAKALEDILYSAWSMQRETFIVNCRPAVCKVLHKHGIMDKFQPHQLKARRLDALRDGLKVVEERHMGITSSTSD